MESELWASAQALVSNVCPAEPIDVIIKRVETYALDFGAYFDLALQLPSGGELGSEQKAAALRHLSRRMGQSKRHFAAEAETPFCHPFRITNLSLEFYSDEELERLVRWWDIEPENALALTAASERELSDARTWVPFAMKKLQECDPDLHDEVSVIVREIVIARPDGSQCLDYGAASSFALWGALAVNAAAHSSWPRYFRTIVHEAAHLFLFGMARHEPLVRDSPERRHSSPLRDDLRPMDGIFHAAFVSARESLAFDRLLSRHEEDGSLLAVEAEEIEELLESSVIAFWECVDRLRVASSLSQLGELIMAECEGYMRENFKLLVP